MPDELSIAIELPGEGIAVVAVAGEVDFNSSPALLRTCTDLIDRGRTGLVLDLSGLGFCDSSGVNALLRIRRHALERGGVVILAAPGEAVNRVLSLSRVDSMLTTLRTVPDALAAITGEYGPNRNK